MRASQLRHQASLAAKPLFLNVEMGEDEID